ncbi:hypothetical protein [Pseudomonas fluorescens]|uniref:hypothetical protein n=1 Tax=Pseudomonas fluorescens TaxID=294 RepID=UPI001912136A|nr:hypothetical protein [Pseudomonas fluorescens]
MFLTFEHAEASVGALVQGGHMWRYVEYLTERPWFYVTLLEPDEESPRRAVYLIPMLEDLLELANAGEQGWTLLQVFIVSPGHLNGSGNWKMNELVSISRVYSSVRSSLAYRVDADVVYFEDELASRQPCAEPEVIFDLRARDSMRY